MQLASVRIVTADIDRLTAFYEELLDRRAERPAPVFSAFPSPEGTLAVSTVDAVGEAAAPLVAPGSNRSVLVEFRLDRPADVDAAFARLRDRLDRVVQEPTTMPWGNRSLLLLDPDGNLVNVFARPA